MRIGEFLGGNSRSNSFAIGLKIFFCLFLIYLITLMAWIGDDAQLTFRQIWNFIHGDGITYNIGERVQSFTHPLWFLVLSFVTFITRELYLTTTVFSIILSLVAVYIILFVEYKNNQSNQFIFSPIFFLVFSFAFMDFTTSGLENSLSYLIFSVIFLILFRYNWRDHLTLIYTLLALLVLNRMDYLILFGPFAFLLIFYTKNFKNFMRVVLPGLLILIAWFTFATIYFGSPYPNTYFAKLNAGYPTEEVLYRGRKYFLALRMDLVTALILIFGFVFSLLSLNRILISLSIGIFLYCAYIWNIGGDFMMGRFFSLSVFISICQLTIALYSQRFLSFKTINISILVILILIIPIGVARSFPILVTNEYISRGRVSKIFDERGYYYATMGLLSPQRRWPEITQLSSKPIDYDYECGYAGYNAVVNSSTHLIDLCALSDPFLSKIPAIQIENWRIGHHVRKMPRGYGEYILGSASEIYDKKLQGLLDDVRLLAWSNLFSLERMKAIIRIHSDYYSDIDFSEYTDPNHWILPTEKKEMFNIENWDQELPTIPWPYYKWIDAIHFKNTLLIKSKQPRYSNLIEIQLNLEHQYEIYVNDKLVQVTYPSCQYRMILRQIKLDSPELVRSLEIRAVGAAFERLPVDNYIIKLVVHELS